MLDTFHFKKENRNKTQKTRKPYIKIYLIFKYSLIKHVTSTLPFAELSFSYFYLRKLCSLIIV